MNHLKVVFVGDGAVGKTCLLIAATTGSFPEEYVPTVFDNYAMPMQFQKKDFELGLWDTAGEEDYDRLRPLSYPQTSVFMICFSVISPTSLENVRTKWVPEITRHCPNVPFILVGCKRDFRGHTPLPGDSYSCARLLSRDEIVAMARQVGAFAYCETSALRNEGLVQSFRVAIVAATSPASGRKERKSKVKGFFARLFSSPTSSPSSPSSVQTAKWTPLFSGAAARYGHNSAMHGSKIFLVGGAGADAPPVQVFDDGNKTWGVFPFAAPAAAGGASTSAAATPTPAEEQLIDTVIGGRFGASAVVGETMYVFGGNTKRGYSKEMVAIHMTTGVVERVVAAAGSKVPSARFGATLTNVGKRKLVLFGGFASDSMASGELFEFDIGTGIWKEIVVAPGRESPADRFHHVAVATPDGMMAVFGGVTTSGAKLNDLWLFDVEHRVWAKVAGSGDVPAKQRGGGACVVNDVMFFFGVDEAGNKPALHSLDLKTFAWKKIAVSGKINAREFTSVIGIPNQGIVCSCGRSLPSVSNQDDGLFAQLFTSVFTMLPSEVWLNVFGFLGARDLCRVAMVCREFRRLSEVDELWGKFVGNLSRPGVPFKKQFLASEALVPGPLLWFNDDL